MNQSGNIGIIGAGPGGLATALKLANEGIPSTVIDKDCFPRDKICGDGISGKTMAALNRVNPEIAAALKTTPGLMTPSWGIRFLFPGKRNVTIAHPSLGKEALASIRPSGYISTRMQFDQTLMEFAQKEPLIQIVENFELKEVNKQGNEWNLRAKDGRQTQHKMIVAADGAHSTFCRRYLKMEIPPQHYAAAVRWYWEGLNEENGYNFLELHFLKDLLPGYFWIFPLGNGKANVGLGMRSDIVAKRRLNLKKLIREVIEKEEGIKERFAGGRPVDDIRGFGLPLGSHKVPLVGDGYVLVGDAAWLIDPLTGEGIPNAIYSGTWAAEIIAQNCRDGNYHAKQLEPYEKKVRDKLELELRISRQLQQMFRYPWLVKVASRIAHNNPKFQEILSSMFNNVDLRKKLRNPLFYVGLLTKR